jgi:hypothetical protein
MMDDAALRLLGDRLRLRVDRSDAPSELMQRLQDRMGTPVFAEERLALAASDGPEGQVVFANPEILGSFLVAFGLRSSLEAVSILLDLLDEAGPK